jgi:D-alanyl-D-alanine carboxypeptidase/D-alanyl-D-alanine-endopeptidase (penicillin-binding protein 4)
MNGQVLGDLILVGGGDPTLDTDGLAAMATGLKEAGIIGVKGGFKVFEAGLSVVERIDPGQPDHVGYNPAVSGIALNFNRVHFEWRRANGDYTVTMEGRSASYRPAVQMARMRIEDRGAPVYTYADLKGRDEWSVARGALGRGGARWLPVRKPGLYAGDVFATLAGAHGIRLKAPQVIDALPKGEVLITRDSPPLQEILQGMLKFSTNLTAEMVGLAASRARGQREGGLKGSAQQMNLWAGETLGMQAPGLVDHSGLGDSSRLTAQDMVRALVTVQASDFRTILKPIFLRDAKGRPQKDHPITIDAKTGTLNFVSTLAGYLTGPDGTEMAFAIFTGDLEARAGIPKEDREAPRGAKSFNNRARRVQRQLLERWGVLYGA